MKWTSEFVKSGLKTVSVNKWFINACLPFAATTPFLECLQLSSLKVSIPHKLGTVARHGCTTCW